MQGSAKVIAKLNELLKGELTSMDLYQAQGRMFDDWGLTKLSARLTHESEDERQHADAIIQRVLFLGGTPNVLARLDIATGKTPKEILELNLAYELDVARNLNDAIALCRNEGDNTTRALLERLLRDTEDDHIHWLESQLHVISQAGLQNYLASQV
jgi:bacterioferritin